MCQAAWQTPKIQMQRFAFECGFLFKFWQIQNSNFFLTALAEASSEIPRMHFHLTYLLRFESRKAEHSNLVNDMLPVVSGALLLQVRHKHLPHLNDAVGHVFHLHEPKRKKVKRQSVELRSHRMCLWWDFISGLTILCRVQACWEWWRRYELHSWGG